MKMLPRFTMAVIFLPALLTGCISSGGTKNGTNSVLVSEVVSICGALVGGQAEQRINQEWEKYPDANASRPVIESMAEVLLTNPESSEQQKTREYRKYITCATGILMTKGVIN